MLGVTALYYIKDTINFVNFLSLWIIIYLSTKLKIVH